MSPREITTFILTPENISELLFTDTVYAGIVVLTLREEMSSIIAAAQQCSHSAIATKLHISAPQVAFAGKIFRGIRHANNVGFTLGGHSIEGFYPSYEDIEPRNAFRDSLNSMLAAIGRGIVVFE